MTDGEDTPRPEPVGQGVPGEEPASLLQRFVAKVIDSILLAIFVSVVVVVLFGALFDIDAGSPLFGGSGLGGFLASVVSAALSIAYYAYLESSRGQTIGKMVMRIEVVGPVERHPSAEAAVKRNLWMALSIIPLIGGLAQLGAAIAIAVTISSSRRGAGWHDDFAGGTRVVKV